jgi:hypothetical protein
MRRLPNGEFQVGAHGWTVLTPSCRGVRWSVDGDGLVVDARDVTATPAGSIVVFSPRARCTPGQWTVRASLSANSEVTADLAVVGAREVPVPGPPPQAPSYERALIGPAETTVTCSIELDETVRTVGARIAVPAGVLLHVRAVELSGPGVDPSDGLHVGLVGATSPFTGGALLARGASATVHARAVVDGAGAGTLVVTRENRYGGDGALVATVEVDGDADITVPIDTACNGAFAIVATLTNTAGGRRQAMWRYVVDDTDGPLSPDAALPWGLTAGTDALDAEGPLLGLLGVGHTRIYSGFAAWDLPAVCTVADHEQGRELLAAAEFIGLSSGTPAVVAATAASGVNPGRPRAGWPNWRLAAQCLRDAEPQQLQPVDELLDAYRGLTVTAEVSRCDDPVAGRTVTEVVAAGCAGRRVAWYSTNEPDLSATPPAAAARRDVDFAAAVRAGAPGSLVVGPMLADGWDGGHQGMTGWDWLTAWLDAGGAETVDAVCLHLHMLDEETCTPERERLEDRLVAARQLVADHDGPAALWVTEMGWRSTASAADGAEPGETGVSVSEADQADLLLRAALLSAGVGVERFLGFHLSGYRPTGGGHRFAWGVVDGAHAGPKPAFAALRRLCRVTSGATSVQLLKTSVRTRSAVFAGEHTGVAYVWQCSGGPGLFSLATPPRAVTITDAVGAPSDGTDLRRVHIVDFPSSAQQEVRSWLEHRLAPRYAEPATPSRPSVSFESQEQLHVAS